MLSEERAQLVCGIKRAVINDIVHIFRVCHCLPDYSYLYGVLSFQEGQAYMRAVNTGFR